MYLNIDIDWLSAKLIFWIELRTIYQPSKHILLHPVSMTLYSSWFCSILLSHHCYLFYDMHAFHKFSWNEFYVYKFVRLYSIHGLIAVRHEPIWRVSFRNVLYFVHCLIKGPVVVNFLIKHTELLKHT